MVDMKLFISVLIIIGTSKTNTKDVRKMEFGRHWDSSYTMRVDMNEVTYDGEGRSTSSYVYKRDATLGKYQSWWSGKKGIIAIEEKDTNGTIWRYYNMDEKKQRCEKYKKTRLDGVWRDDHPGNMKDKLVNTYQEGNKIYLQYYYTIYDDEMAGRLKRWWTTVYDIETGSYLPYKRDEYWNDWETRYTFVSLTNYTYTPTTMEWVPLPHYC